MAGPQYLAEPARRIKSVRLGGITALFHRPSARTHLVGSPVPEILDALQETAMDANALLTFLQDRYEVADADPASLAARLAELEAAGLVRVA
ncbi:HPr-rel-A system PqqD family peptide chaperone [Stakelama sp. CBK3Z-3]|uniref:HPr-rel-A system PqqD family peptide chaperone n=1 Tax=Stakelama flava TaxID=2860338 RepID=A0ABS6XKA9_9SPHN|nr:HPr-rel-A system PqqD family peptide chaperone [Stakelama flava]MBW4330364.1 HPr-rel-A system PqqD family peptide chaperone [Stakelama flava]